MLYTATLCLVHDDQKVLLGMKKKGFGAGLWNGFGGKMKAGESVEACARREMEEEIGVTLDRLEKRGRMRFSFAENEDVWDVHVFRGIGMHGEPQESDEMRPQWYALDAIPFDVMWPDDRHWIPLFLAGKKFRCQFHFGPNNIVLRHELEELNDATLL